MEAMISLGAILDWCEGRSESWPLVPDRLAPLVRSGRAVDTLRLDDARRELAALEVEAGTLEARLAALFEAQLILRGGSDHGSARIDELVEVVLASVDPDEAPIRARALLARGISELRRNDLASAERSIADAVTIAPSADPSRIHAANAWATLMQAYGAWIEAEFTLEQLVEQRASDPVGASITAGSLGRQWLESGRYDDVLALVDSTLGRHESSLGRVTVVRLRTLALEAAMRMSDAIARQRAASALRAVLSNDPSAHFHDGYGWLALATNDARDGRLEDARRATDAARGPLQSDVGERALLATESTLFGDDDVVERAIDTLAGAGDRSLDDGELTLHLHAVQTASTAGRSDLARSRLERAYGRAMLTNHPGQLRRLDSLSASVAPLLHVEQVVRRFSGSDVDALETTRRADVSIVFADMVGYSVVSQTMSPEEVMRTVRGLFELAAYSLVAHQLTPANFLGDAVLAIAEGPDHALRATLFACEFVARVMRVGRLRLAFGGSFGPRLRAGVSTGTVVRGPLGVHLKKDFAAIGVPTNLAARLQGLAEPGEVVVSKEVVVAAGLSEPVTEISAKGWDLPVPVARIDAESFVDRRPRSRA